MNKYLPRFRLFRRIITAARKLRESEARRTATDSPFEGISCCKTAKAANQESQTEEKKSAHPLHTRSRSFIDWDFFDETSGSAHPNKSKSSESHTKDEAIEGLNRAEGLPSDEDPGRILENKKDSTNNMEDPTADSDEKEEESLAITMSPLIYDETDKMSKTSDLPRSRSSSSDCSTSGGEGSTSQSASSDCSTSGEDGSTSQSASSDRSTSDEERTPEPDPRSISSDLPKSDEQRISEPDPRSILSDLYISDEEGSTSNEEWAPEPDPRSKTSDLPRSDERRISEPDPRSISSESTNHPASSGGSLLCRLCATRNNDMIYIFGQDQIHDNIIEKIKQSLPTISVKESDTMTKHVCKLCVSRLELWYNFYNSVIEVQKYLANNDERTLFSDANGKNNDNESTTISKESEIIETNTENNVDSFNSNPQSSSSSFPVTINNLTEEKRTENVNEINEPSTSQIEKNIGNSVISEKKEVSDRKSRSSKKTQTSKTEIIRHNRIPTCHICKVVFESKRRCHSHARNHFSNDNFPCSFCGKSFTAQNKWRKHSRLHVFGKRRTVSPASSNVCGEILATRAELKLHEATRQDVTDTSTQSDESEKILDSEKSSDEHKLNVRIKPKTSVRDVCKKRSSTEADLDDHKEKGNCHLECKKCKIRFDFDDTFEMHKATCCTPALKVKIYRCSHCGKEFKRSVELASHVSHHHRAEGKILKVEPERYDCDFCHKTFSTYDAIALHLEKHAPEVTRRAPVLQIRINRCDQSGKEAKHSAVLASRVSHHHRTGVTPEVTRRNPELKERMYRCNKCEKEFKRSVELASHVSHHHRAAEK